MIRAVLLALLALLLTLALTCWTLWTLLPAHAVTGDPPRPTTHLSVHWDGPRLAVAWFGPPDARLIWQHDGLTMVYPMPGTLTIPAGPPPWDDAALADPGDTLTVVDGDGRALARVVVGVRPVVRAWLPLIAGSSP